MKVEKVLEYDIKEELKDKHTRKERFSWKINGDGYKYIIRMWM